MYSKIQFITIGIAAIVVLGIGYYNIVLDSDHDSDTQARAGENDSSGIAPEKEGVVRQDDIKNDITPETLSDSATDVVTEAEVGDTDNPWGEAPVVSVSVPDLNRPVVFSAGFTEEEKESITSNIEALIGILKEDNNRFNEWKALGLLLKSTGDYEGAKAVWEYAGAIRPMQSLTFANLGTLYGYYLNDPLRAETNLLHAIENEPRALDLYARMTDFYLEVAKSKEKALGFLDRSIAKYPDWEDLKTLRGYVAKK